MYMIGNLIDSINLNIPFKVRRWKQFIYCKLAYIYMQVLSIHNSVYFHCNNVAVFSLDQAALFHRGPHRHY